MTSALAIHPVLTFGLERLQDIQEEVNLLWRAHYDETEGYRHAAMNPNMEQFYRMEDTGMFREFTARDNGVLIGHLGYIVHIDRHTSLKTATEDYFYLLRSHRAGFNALHFLRYAINSLKAESCKQIGMSSKLTNDIEPLLRRIGFDFVAKFYVMTV